MNIGVLTSPDTAPGREGQQLYETERYIKEIEAAGHTPLVVNFLETVVAVNEAGTLLYEYNDDDESQPLSSVDLDVVIPNIAGHDGHVHEGVIALRALMANNLPSTHKPETILNANNKMVSHLIFEKAGIPTLYSAMPIARLPAKASTLFKLVEKDRERRHIIKHVEGTGGKGVMIPGSRLHARTVLNSLDINHQPFLVQEYIEAEEGEKVHSDVRILVINGEVIASMRRQRCEEDEGEEEGGLLTGVSSGGTAQEYEVKPREADLALRAAEALDTAIAGVDIMHAPRPHLEPLVNEVNVFPGLQIEKVTNVNVAKEVVAYAVQLYYEAHPQAVADAELTSHRGVSVSKQPQV
jgi:RimK family alpha-L-glutamate ligase